MGSAHIAHADLQVIAKMEFLLPSAVDLDGDFLAAKFEARDLHGVAGACDRAFPSHFSLQALQVERLADGDLVARLFVWKRLSGFRKLAVDETDDSQLRLLSHRAGLALGLLNDPHEDVRTGRIAESTEIEFTRGRRAKPGNVRGVRATWRAAASKRVERRYIVVLKPHSKTFGRWLPMTIRGLRAAAAMVPSGLRAFAAQETGRPAAAFTALCFSSSILCCARKGSKQRRQRASYIPPAPTTMSSSDATSRCVWTAGFPQRMQMARSLVISSATARRRGMGSNGRPMKSVSRPATITRLPKVGELRARLHHGFA